MTTVRQQVAAPAKIGPLEFEATVASGGGSRNLSAQGGIGRDGEDHDDLGEGARRETLEAELDEITYQRLDNLRRAAKPYTIVHPLLGAFWGRIHRARYTGRANPDLLAVTIELVEEGDHTTQMPAQVVSLPAAAAAARSAFDDLGLDGLADIPELGGLPDALSSSMPEFEAAWADFDTVMSAVEFGTASWEEVSGSFVALGDAVQGVLDDAERAYEQSEQWITTTVEGGLHTLMAAAGDVVTAARGAGAAWLRQLELPVLQTIWEVAEEHLGASDDDTVAELLAANSQLVDIVAIPAGTQLQIPVR